MVLKITHCLLTNDLHHTLHGCVCVYVCAVTNSKCLAEFQDDSGNCTLHQSAPKLEGRRTEEVATPTPSDPNLPLKEWETVDLSLFYSQKAHLIVTHAHTHTHTQPHKHKKAPRHRPTHTNTHRHTHTHTKHASKCTHSPLCG